VLYSAQLTFNLARRPPFHTHRRSSYYSIGLHVTDQFSAGGIAQAVVSTPRAGDRSFWDQLPGDTRAFSIVKTVGLWAHSDAVQ
jgi:hypothetical protein